MREREERKKEKEREGGGKRSIGPKGGVYEPHEYLCAIILCVESNWRKWVLSSNE